MLVVRTRSELAQALASLREGGRSIGLVPTMGFLHEGHLSLVDAALARADSAVASIFVNPLQFGPSEDLASYPRDEARDLALLGERGAALVFVPSVGEMYPGGDPAVTVSPGSLGGRLCGAFRPGHFAGVLTVVAKLLGLFRPDVAVFGRKDFQQAALIRRMVTDLELRVRIETAPIVREHDGLAMSSRNSYLNAAERSQAPAIHRGLEESKRRWREGEHEVEPLLRAVRDRIAREPLMELQYVEAVDPRSLDPVEEAEPGTVLAVAAYCGSTRLIDNVELA
ncbi:MAG TPA: pantoate--beta-alanine ligase [Longimicrobiales bacterium]|nr:pantoate--beta-alanine ligase [Longimicrobiales bacterium]